ncbi:mitochondrial protein [Rickenella mellea]|uniref:Mitochondrial protein n=1 Tax=Rickenella mellea TaxID=50990 RepID=A0A4Y7PYF9_9AGAM|nr:mitochondrial protein [Rickenella mellea]
MDDEAPLSAPPLKPPLQNKSAPRDQEPSGDAEKLRKWHEERLERKLRGEYESAVQHLAELIHDNSETRMRIANIRVDGANTTRRSFLAWLIKPHVPESSLSNLGSVLNTTRSITHILNETDIFASALPTLTISRSPLARDGDIDLIFKTRERGKFFLKTATEFGDGEGNASVQGKIRNVFGGAEVLEGSVSLGTRTRKAFNLSLSAPLTSSLKTRGELLAYGLERDYTSFASCVEGERGVKATIRSLVKGGIHEFAYEASLRRIGDLKPTASLSIRESAGQTLKSAVSHTWSHDTRDDRTTATRGSYIKTFQELAGLGGDAFFYKSQSNLQLSRPVWRGSTVSFAMRSGVLWPFFGKASFFPDRFQLGGPLDVRLFKQNSMGPRDGVTMLGDADSIGGDLYWAAGVSLISDIPWKPHWPLKTHVFVNAGRLDSMDRSKSFVDNVRTCVSQPSISSGIGLLYRFDPVRVELNFGVPLVASKSDGHRRGFQLGIGLDFL